jgi:hypothetical protein
MVWRLILPVPCTLREPLRTRDRSMTVPPMSNRTWLPSRAVVLQVIDQPRFLVTVHAEILAAGTAAALPANVL